MSRPLYFYDNCNCTIKYMYSEPILRTFEDFLPLRAITQKTVSDYIQNTFEIRCIAVKLKMTSMALQMRPVTCPIKFGQPIGPGGIGTPEVLCKHQPTPIEETEI